MATKNEANKNEKPIKKVETKPEVKEKVKQEVKYTNCFLPEEEYFQSEVPKKQIVLHHTVGGDNYKSVIHYWCKGKSHIATAFLITREGEIVTLFDPRHWAYHIGLKAETFKTYGIPRRNSNKESIGIELLNYGRLIKEDDKFYTIYGQEVDAKNVISYDKPYRGYLHYEKYTDIQLKAMTILVKQLGIVFDIPTKFREDMFDFNLKALTGDKGVYAHAAFRKDKSDVHPQPELIKYLKTLK